MRDDRPSLACRAPHPAGPTDRNRPTGTGSRGAASRALHLVAPRTRRQVVVDHADRLHEGVHRRRPDEAEAAALELLGERLGLRRGGGQVGERLRHRRGLWGGGPGEVRGGVAPPRAPRGGRGNGGRGPPLVGGGGGPPPPPPPPPA